MPNGKINPFKKSSKKVSLENHKGKFIITPHISDGEDKCYPIIVDYSGKYFKALYFPKAELVSLDTGVDIDLLMDCEKATILYNVSEKDRARLDGNYPYK